MAQTKVADKATTDDGSAVVFTFANGKRLVCVAAALPDKVAEQALLHGISARVGDTYAGASSQPDPVDWAYRTACAAWAAMCGGQWTVRTSTGGALAEALVRVTGRTADEARDAIAKLDEKAKKKLAGLPAIKVALAEIALERARDKVQASDEMNDPLDLL